MRKIIFVILGLLFTYNIYVTYTLVKVKETFKEFHLLYSSIQKTSKSQSEYIEKVNDIRSQEININRIQITKRTSVKKKDFLINQLVH